MIKVFILIVLSISNLKSSPILSVRLFGGQGNEMAEGAENKISIISSTPVFYILLTNNSVQDVTVWKPAGAAWDSAFRLEFKTVEGDPEVVSFRQGRIHTGPNSMFEKQNILAGRSILVPVTLEFFDPKILDFLKKKSAFRVVFKEKMAEAAEKHGVENLEASSNWMIFNK